MSLAGKCSSLWNPTSPGVTCKTERSSSSSSSSGGSSGSGSGSGSGSSSSSSISGVVRMVS